MPCGNCRATTDPAYTLAAHPEGDGEAIVVDFCSIDCLQVWTTVEAQNFGRWRWESHEAALEESPASPAD